MKRLEENESFINQLLEETYQVLPSEICTDNYDDLYSYFKKKSQDSSELNPLILFKESDIPFFNLAFNFETSCYRLSVGDLNLDIPSNWSFCKDIHKMVEEGRQGFVCLRKSHYSDFVDVLDSIFGIDEDIDQRLLVHDKNVYLVLIANEKRETLDYLDELNSFEHLDYVQAA